jgi:four helix bundle protein
MGAAIRDLKLWQEAVALGAEVVRALRPANRREVKSVIEHAMATAVNVATLVTDGYAHYEAGEQQQLYSAARRELLRLETELALARHAQLLSPASDAQLTTRAQAVARLLTGYLAYLDRQLSDQRAAPVPAAQLAGVRERKSQS